MAAVIFESVRDCKMLVQQLERHETQRHESNGNFPHAPFYFLARSFDQLQKFLSAAEFLWVHSTWQMTLLQIANLTTGHLCVPRAVQSTQNQGEEQPALYA